jgi:hypothetical protein
MTAAEDIARALDVKPPPAGCQELAKALAMAQADIRSAEKDATNPHFRSRYATLSSVWDACREPLTRNGLSVVQLPQLVAGQLMLETRLLHTSGEWLSSWWPIQPVKDDPQGLGAALTYARRYTLAAMVGVAPDDDDDGESAMKAIRAAAAPKAAPSPALAKVLASIHAVGSGEALEQLRRELEQDEPLPEAERKVAIEAFKRKRALFAKGEEIVRGMKGANQ